MLRCGSEECAPEAICKLRELKRGSKGNAIEPSYISLEI